MTLKRVGNTRSLIDVSQVVGTSDDKEAFTVLFRNGQTLIFTDKAERDAAFALLYQEPPDVPPESRGSWSGNGDD